MTAPEHDRPDLDDGPQRDPSELPVAVEMKWFRAWDRGTASDFNDYYFLVTWADGTTENHDRIRNEWHAIKPLADPAKLDETLANLARGDNDFRPVHVNPITPKHAA